MSLAVALIAVFATADSAPTVVRLPKGYLHVRLELPGFAPDEDQLKSYRGTFGGGALLAGALAGDQATVSMIADKNDGDGPQVVRFSTGGAKEKFEVAGIPCELSVQKQDKDASLSEYWARPVLPGYSVDLRVTAIAVRDGISGFQRQDFEALVSSMRFASLRRGKWEDYPQALLDAMDGALRGGTEPLPGLEAKLKANKGDWALLLTKAELLAGAEQQKAERADCYKAALAGLAKVKDGGPGVAFASALAYDGLGLVLQSLKKHADAVAPLEKGYKIAGDLGHPMRASFAYNLASSHAVAKNATRTVQYLKEAIAADPEYKEKAAKDRDFDGIRDRVEFKALMNG